MKKLSLLTLISVVLLVLPACEVTDEEEANNNPEELVAKWELSDFQSAFEIMTNSNQNLVDFTSQGVGSGLTITGDGINETLKYLNPIFLFFTEMNEEDNHGSDNMDDGIKFIFAAQNLDWSVYESPEDFIGQTMKMFLLLEDHEEDYYHDGTMLDTVIIMAAYMKWEINDTSDFFFDDQPPDSLYLALEAVDFTFNESNHELTLNNLSLTFAEIIVLDDSESTYRDTLIWDSTRTVVANGNLAPATISLSANTPTTLGIPFFGEDEMEDGPPLVLEFHEDGTLDLVETYFDCDEFHNCNEITEYLAGNWWTEGTDSLIVAVEYPGEGIDTIDLIYQVTDTDLSLIYHENPCEEWIDETYTEEQCRGDFEHMFFGLQEGSLSSVELIMNIQYKKNDAMGRRVMKPTIKRSNAKGRASSWLHALIHFPMR